MLPRRPRLRVDSGVQSIARPPSCFSPVTPPETPVYPHTSVFRSPPMMELQINSPNVKATQHSEGHGLVPVYGEHDRISGQVVFGPSCSLSGRLSISVEGTFAYTPSNAEEVQDEMSSSQSPGKQKVVFFSSSTAIAWASGSDTAPPRSTFRVRVRRPSLSKRPSLPVIGSPAVQTPRSFPFSFEIPRGSREGEEMPSSFTSSMVMDSGPRGKAFTEGTDVAYRVTALWESNDGDETRTTLEAPFLFQPDTDFQSLDAQEPDAWLEMPLRSDRPIPFQCAITLPSPGVFSRRNAIPYFVVFTTTPRSTDLAREIASDATISVSLVRQVTISTPSSLPPTPPQTPPGSDESDPSMSTGSGSSILKPRRNLLKRVVRSASPVLSWTTRSLDPTTPDDHAPPKDKPLPRLPTDTFSECKTLHTDVCIGFPKRPRHPCTSPQEHPSLESYTSLPDGLLKGKVQLNKSMIPGIDWPGVSVKYYLDVSIVVGQDDLRARIPIRIV